MHQFRAKKIMGRRMVLLGEVSEYMGVDLNKYQDQNLASGAAYVDISRQRLKKYAANYLLVFCPEILPTITTLIDHVKENRKLTFKDEFFLGHNFAQKNYLNNCWYLIRKNTLRGSRGWTFAKQEKALGNKWRGPALLYVYLIVLYYYARGELLYTYDPILTSDFDAYGKRVAVMTLPDRQISIFPCDRRNAKQLAGLAPIVPIGHFDDA